MPYSATLGSFVIGSSLESIVLTENNNLSQIDASQIFDEIQPVTPTEKAVRIGN